MTHRIHPLPARPIRAVVFDHDGTLIDSLAVVVAASNAILAAEGHAPQPRDTIVAGMVLPTPERLGALLGASDPTHLRTLGARYDALALTLAHGATSYPGIPSLLKSLQSRGLPLAVVSNSAHAFLEAALRHAGLWSCFSAVVGADDVALPKPDPCGLLGVIAQLRCAPDDCIYVGDSHTDLTTARRAGVHAIGVTWGAHPRAELAPMGFDALVDTPHQLLELVEAWNRAARDLPAPVLAGPPQPQLMV